MRKLDTKALYRYAGNEAQLFGVRRLTLEEGSAKGVTLLQVTTAGGLEFDILPDTGLDIGRLKFRGLNMNYTSKNGYDSPSRFLPVSGNFDRYFPGGMLFTCGLLSAGPENTDDEFHPLHGRYHGQSARSTFSYTEGDNLIIGGEVRETEQGRHNLSLKRKYTVPAWGSELVIDDEITNLTTSPAEYMMLYHINFGWPMLSGSAALELPSKRKVTPRTPYAEAGLSKQCEFCEPIDNEEEQVFFNEMESEPYARLRNPELGITAEVSWSLDTLPILAQWKNMKSGDYVLGLEPSSCYIMGRSKERTDGRLRTLAPFDSIHNTVKLSFSEQ